MNRYFAYGTNMSMEGMAIRCPTAKASGWAKLKGWQPIMNTAGWPTIVPCPDATLYGGLWELTTDDEAALDHYEDVADGLYTKQGMTVTARNEKSQPTLVYIAANSMTGQIAEKEVIQDILSGAEQFELPPNYIHHLKSHFAGD